MTRREFVAVMAVVSFGRLPPRRLETIGLQLYTVRRLLARDWAPQMKNWRNIIADSLALVREP